MYNNFFPNGSPTGYYNPYTTPVMPSAKQQVVRVNGEEGARAYRIEADSSALLLDVSGLMVWLVTTDGAGYKTVSPYDITPHKTTVAADTVPAKSLNDLTARVERLEAFINECSTDTSAARQIKSHDAEHTTA